MSRTLFCTIFSLFAAISIYAQDITEESTEPADSTEANLPPPQETPGSGRTQESIDAMAQQRVDAQIRYGTPENTYEKYSLTRHRQSTRTGMAFFFVGMGINIASAFIPVKSEEDLILAMIPAIISGPMMMAGVPVAGAHASAAQDIYYEQTGMRMSKPQWTVYGLGWGCYVFSTIFGVAGALNGSTEILTVAVFAQMGSWVAWGFSSIKSCLIVKDVGKKLEKENRGISWRIAPTIGTDGKVGLSLRTVGEF